MITSNVSEVIARLQNRKVRIHSAGVEACNRLADVGEDSAREGFAEAAYPGDNDVTVFRENQRKGISVVAEGQAVAFIEFGTGITNAPYPGELPAGVVPHGMYDQRKGSNPKGWVYSGSPGTGGLAWEVSDMKRGVRKGIWRTKGNPPAGAMLRAANDMRDAVPRILREVFKR